MKRKHITFSLFLALMLSLFSVVGAGAHGDIQVETPNNAASRTDWFGLQPETAGVGIVQRNAAQQGEFVINDAGKDQRIITTSQPITRETDLDWFSVSADPTYVSFLAKVDNYSGIANNPALELIITIDTDQGNNSGTRDLPIGSGTFSTTQVTSDAAWEYALRTTFSPGSSGSRSVNGTTRIYTNASSSNICALAACPSQVASAAAPQGSFAEIKVPWAQIGGKPTGAKFLRLTVETLYSNHAVPADGYNSPVIDVLGKTGTTLADIQDGTIDSSFDVHFNTNGATPTYEPYAPLEVTEFQPNPVGNDSPGPTNTSKDTEWIEVYNPNSFAIPLSDYKLGNAAKPNTSTQGMYKFKAASIAGGAVVVVAREKARFLAGHPGYTGTVYDLSNDMTQYTAWASGPLQLDNGPSVPGGAYEEQVLLLDAKDGIVDMATYGTPTTPYPGHTPIPVSAVPEGASYERCPASRDTNNSNVDFTVHATLGEQTPGIACTGVPGLDLTIAKTGPANPTKDETTGVRTATFTINYSNIGTAPENAAVTVVDTLPAGLTFQSSSPLASASPDGKTLTWTFGSGLGVGASGTIVLTTTVDVSIGENVPLVNTATINGPSEPVAARTNNSASATVTTLGPADLDVSSTFSGPITPNTQFGFIISYRNTGQDEATDIKITDLLPAGVSIVSQQSDGAVWDNATTNTVTWSIASLGPGQGGQITILAKLDNAAVIGSALSNTVSISVPTNDPTPNNNTESKTVQVGQRKLYLPITNR